MALGNANGLNKTTLDDGTVHPLDRDGATIALTILYHPVVERIGERALLSELAVGNPALLSRTEPAFAHPGQTGGEPLGDEHLSRRPLRLVLAAGGGLRLEIGGTGTSVVIRGRQVHGTVLIEEAQLQRGVVLELGHRVVLLLHKATTLLELVGAAQTLGDTSNTVGTMVMPPVPWKATHLSEPARAPQTLGEASNIVGASDSLQRVLWEVSSVADLQMPVLLRGETGSGKELVALAIHRLSSRRKRPFVPVNLGAIPASLAAAELFGAEKGAFTGAVKRHAGYFEQARGGTLFLDEIGEAPIEVQVALLRVLETKEMQMLGAQGAQTTDVRVIAATDADLEEKVEAGTFRAPLLNRLSAYEIWIPPLRERKDDFGRLLIRFLREELERINELHRLKPPEADARPWLPASLVARLAEYDWPGNVRQLQNVVRQLVVGNRGRARVEMTPAVERLLSEQNAPSEPPSGDASPPDAPAPVLAPEPRPPVILAASKDGPSEEDSAQPLKVSVNSRRPADISEAELKEVLRAHRWDFAAAAGALGISRASIYVLIDRYRIRTAGSLMAEEIVRAFHEHGGKIPRMADELEVSERALARRVKELRLT